MRKSFLAPLFLLTCSWLAAQQNAELELTQ